MLLSSIIKNVNRLVSNNSSFALNYDNLKFYLDQGIDYINLELKTLVPTIAEDWEQNYCIYRIIYSPKFIKQYDENGTYEDGTLYYECINNEYYYFGEGAFHILDPTSGYVPDLDLYIPELPITKSTYDYTLLSDQMIRSVLIYYTAASYLEEEDEFEDQRNTYLERARTSLSQYRTIRYCMYQVKQHSLEKRREKCPHKERNPYNICDSDEDW